MTQATSKSWQKLMEGLKLVVKFFADDVPRLLLHIQREYAQQASGGRLFLLSHKSIYSRATESKRPLLHPLHGFASYKFVLEPVWHDPGRQPDPGTRPEAI